MPPSVDYPGGGIRRQSAYANARSMIALRVASPALTEMAGRTTRRPG